MANDPNGVAVLTTGPSEVQATLIIAALRQRGIPAWIIGEWTSGFRAEAPGGVWILVRQADFERAQVVLRTVKAQQPGTDRQ
jgi:hypothetical protein